MITTIQPRMIADIAAANGYDIVDFTFSVDYYPTLYRFELETYKAYDDRDLLIYIVLRKKNATEFRLPFDSIFTDKNTLSSYQRLSVPQTFSSYIKGSWSNVKPNHLNEVPTDIQTSPHRYRRWIKRMIDSLGGWF